MVQYSSAACYASTTRALINNVARINFLSTKSAGGPRDPGRDHGGAHKGEWQKQGHKMP